MNNALNQWNKDTATLNDFKTNWNDTLTVSNNFLNLEKGTRRRRNGEQITPDPKILADHLEKLVKETSQRCFEILKTQQNTCKKSDFYEKVASFKRQFKHLSTRISDLQYIFRNHDCKNNEYAERFSSLFDLAYKFKEEVKNYRSTLQKPEAKDRPIKPIEYDERTSIRSIKSHRSQRTPISEILNAARKALKLPQRKPQALRIKCLNIIQNEGFIVLPALVTFALLTALKIVLWNPFEWLTQGSIKTTSALNWFLDHETPKNHIIAYQCFTNQLMTSNEITEEVVQAFEELAPHAKELYLEYACLRSKKMTDLEPYMKKNTKSEIISRKDLLQQLQNLCKEKKIKYLKLSVANWCYRELNKPNSGYTIEKIFQSATRIFDRLENKHHPQITPKALNRLLKAAFTSKTCQKIQLSHQLEETPPVRDLLKKKGYRFKKDNGPSYICTRWPNFFYS